MMLPNTIVEIREGGDVRAALLLSVEGGALRLALSDGREIRVPRERVVHDAGAPLAPGADAVRGLKAWEADAESLARSVDLEALHGLVLGAGGVTPSLGDLAGVALGHDTPHHRAATLRALARPNAWFRFDGKTFLPLSPEEVARELERRRKARDLAAERDTFIAVAARRARGERPDWPPGAPKFLRSLEDLAVDGESSPARREAGLLLEAISAQPPDGARPHAARPNAAPTPEEAFTALVAMGVFGRDENLSMRRAHVRTRFPEDVLQEAERLATIPLDATGRLDLGGLEIVTIDDASTTEVDDGVSFEPTASGFRLGVHIADASYYVPPASLVDSEALERGTSYYLPEHVLPMLPPVLGEGAASLTAGQRRPALSFFLDFTPHGELRHQEVRETVLTVSARLTYEDCDAALGAGPPTPGGTAAPRWLTRVHELTEALERERLELGASPIRAPELHVSFDAAGEPVIRLVDPGRPARRFVSELMILANRTCAEFCRARGLPAIYRRQSPPEAVVPRPPLDRYDPVAVAAFRRVLQRTEVTLEPGPHAGLGLPAYVQATSPLRRYQDLAVHRLVKASLRGQPLPHPREAMLAIADITEQAGRNARLVETETDEYWVLRALERRVGQVLDGVLVRVEERRTWVEIPEYARQFPLAPRPDHVPGQPVRLKVRSVRLRPGRATFEEVRG